MTRFINSAFLAIFLTVPLAVYTQTLPTPTATPVAGAKLSEQLSRNLDGLGPAADIPREKREQAYAKLLEAQRNIYRMNIQRTRSGQTTYADLARNALVAALQADPELSEAYVALTEISLIMSNDLDEAAALSRLAIRVNKNSLGGHKFLARVLSRQSGLRGTTIDPQLAESAIAEWKEVARMDPRSSEAWAMLSELYQRTNRTEAAIEPLRRWVASAMPADAGWFRLVVGGRPEEILPERAPQQLAAALIRLGHTQEAMNVLAEMLSDDPDNSDVMAQIDEAVEKTDPKTIGKAIEPIRQIVVSHPNSINLLSFFASLDAKAGNVDEAVKMLTAASARLQPSDRPAAANLQMSVGDVFSIAGRYPDAAAAYEKALAVRGLDKALTLDPDEREFALTIYDKLITAYKKAERIEDAKSAILRARKLLGKDDLFADRELVSLYRALGQRSEALAAVRDVRSRIPDDVTMLRLEATVLTELGQVDRAVELIKQRIASGKSELPIQRYDGKTPIRLDDDFSNYIFICQLYNDAGRGLDAAAAAQKALGVAGSDDRRQIARLMTATSYQTARKFEEAETILRDILKQTPGNPIALNNLGYFLLERGQRFDEALELIRKAVAIDPNNPSYLDSLGWAYLKLDRIDEAVGQLERAARLDDTSATIHEHLGDAYRKKGSLDLARNAWQRATVLMSGASDIARVKEKIDNLR